jgi:sporulation protein YlmC with PRC-barrel domain
MQQEESIIRDLIAKHPEIISNELEFIDKEVYISNDKTIRIDILAWDTNVNRPTIIEIKKDELYATDDESRKAIGQIIQYRAYFGMINGNDKLYDLLVNKKYIEDGKNIPIPRLILLVKEISQDLLIACNMNHIEVLTYKSKDIGAVQGILTELKTKKISSSITDEQRRKVIPKINKKIIDFINKKDLECDHYHDIGFIQFEEIEFGNSDLKWHITEIFEDAEDDLPEFDEFVRIYCVKGKYLDETADKVFEIKAKLILTLDKNIDFEEGILKINKQFLFNSDYKIVDSILEVIESTDEAYRKE